jgi:hypothetical protein
MKKYITVSAKDAAEIKKVIRNVGIGMAMHEAYAYVKQELQRHGIGHKETNASHHSELPHQGGYVSIYLDPNGQWYQAEH